MIVAGFRAAQHALDSATDARAVSASVEVALAHLNHVSQAVATYSGDADEQAAVDAADAFELSLRRIIARAPDAVPVRLRMINALIRDELGLSPSATSGTSQKRETASDESYARAAITPALQMVTLRARHALWELEVAPPQSEKRDATVASLSESLEASCRYVGTLLGQLSYEQRQPFVPEVTEAAAAVHSLLRWIRSRQPRKSMESNIRPTVAALDVILLSVGQKAIEARPAPTLTERGVHAAEREHSDVETAADDLRDAITALQGAQMSAVSTFEELAKLEDVAQPSMVETILKAVLSTAMGFVSGELVKVLTTIPATATLPATSVNDQLRMLVNMGLGTTSTSIQAAWAQVTTDQSIALARIVFAAAMRKDIEAKAKEYKKHVSHLLHESSASSKQLEAMAAAVNASISTTDALYVRQLSHAWASYLAQSKLHTRGDRTSNMTDYFGKPSSGGREFGTSKQGTPGVLQVVMIVDERGRSPRQDPEATKIVGLNSQLRANVLADAGHRFDRVRLPKEIHVHAEFGRAIIALDEQNRYQDAVNWGQVQQHVGVSALQFWKIYGGRLTLQ